MTRPTKKNENGVGSGERVLVGSTSEIFCVLLMIAGFSAVWDCGRETDERGRA